ncbi:MAG: porin family protein [Bacteroidales bacterium]|nr:porin family protein [Bacteroidales bacterium]MDD4685570.1 porin family protein [Bacteroidales bacterium]
MKKTIVLVALILVSVVSISQTKYGVRAGMTLSTYNSSQSIYQFKPGIHIGGVADIPIASSKFSFVPGVYFADKGAKIYAYVEPGHGYNYYYKVNISSYQLQIPLLFTYNISINDKIKLKPQIGGFLSYEIFGIYNEKRDYEGTDSSNVPNEMTSYYYFYDDYFILTYGGNIGLSIFYNKYSFTLSCDVGSLFETRLSYSNYPDICMFFSLGYNF